MSTTVSKPLIITPNLNIRKVIKLDGKSLNDNNKLKSGWNPQNGR